MEESYDLSNFCINCMQDKGPNIICPHCHFDEANYQELPHHLPLRTILNGKYLIGKVLGEGGFGITYKAWDLNLEIPLAIKEYYPCSFAARNTNNTGSIYPYSSNEDLFNQGKDKFIDEARRLAKFQNLHSIVSVKDYFIENNTAYIVMEYLDGITLKQLLKQDGPLKVEACLDLLKNLILSLETIHQSKIIHRDISPDNIIIQNDGQIKLIDFGAARQIENNEQSKTINVKHGYAPIEQYLSHGNQGPWGDIYALSATIYTCITGTNPPPSLERLKSDKLVPPSKLGIEIRPEQEEALLKGLALNHEDRFKSAQELYNSLYQVNPSPKPKPQPVSTVLSKKWWQNKKMIQVIAVLCFITILISGFTLLNQNDDSPKKESKQTINLTEKEYGKPLQSSFYQVNDKIYIYTNNTISRYSVGSFKDEEKILSNIDTDNFTVYKEWLYYIDNDANILYRYNMDNNKLSAISNDDMENAFNLQIYDHKLYYLLVDTSNTIEKQIIQIDLKTGNYNEFKETKCYYGFCFENNYLYYSALNLDNQNTEIGKINLETKKTQKLLDVNKKPLNLGIDNNVLYFTTYHDKTSDLYMYNIKNDKLTKLYSSSKLIGDFAVSDDHEYVYYFYLDENIKNKTGLYRVKQEKNAIKELVCKDGTNQFVSPYDSNMIYFINEDGLAVSKFNTDNLTKESWITSYTKIEDLYLADDYIYFICDETAYCTELTNTNEIEIPAPKTTDNETTVSNDFSDYQLQYNSIKNRYSNGSIEETLTNEVTHLENDFVTKITNIENVSTTNYQRKAIVVDISITNNNVTDIKKIYPFDFILYSLGDNDYFLPVNTIYKGISTTFPITVEPNQQINLQFTYYVNSEMKDFYFIQSNIVDNQAGRILYITKCP